MKNIFKISYGCWPRGLLIKTRFETIKYGRSNTRKKLTKSFTGQGKWCTKSQLWMAPVFSGLRLFPSTPYPSLPHNHHLLRRPSLCWRWNQFSFTNVSFSPCTGKAPSPTLHFDAAHIPRQYPRHWNRFPPQPGMWVSSPGSRSGPSLSKGVQQKFTE